MNRRTFLSVISGVAASGSVVLGTNAFSTVSTGRKVSVATVSDTDAYLSLNDVGEGGRASIDGGKLKFRIPGSFEQSNAEGVGPNSVYRFGADVSDSSDSGLFTIQNRGTSPIAVFSSQPTTSDVPEITIYDTKTGDRLTESDPYEPLDVGEEIKCGLEIDTQGVEISEYSVTVRIHGKNIE